MTRLRLAIAALVVWLALLASGTVLGATPMPLCPEDAVLVGQGNFEHGRYDSYKCGPAVDDYAPDYAP